MNRATSYKLGEASVTTGLEDQLVTHNIWSPGENVYCQPFGKWLLELASIGYVKSMKDGAASQTVL